MPREILVSSRAKLTDLLTSGSSNWGSMQPGFSRDLHTQLICEGQPVSLNCWAGHLVVLTVLMPMQKKEKKAINCCPQEVECN